MHHASLEKSERLKRALKALIDARGWITTRGIIRQAGVCAVNSVIAELRENGCVIETRQEVSKARGRVFSYRLLSYPKPCRKDAHAPR